ncbi:MAG: DEAD/DEAH box helicase, partial [Stellaceae bacterium]
MSLPKSFHPALAEWFGRSFAAPTAAQAEAWPAIQSGRHTLIAAPTGSGKTLAAFLASIDALVRQGVNGGLADETQIVYVSPLKALSNDIQRNLEAPLAGIREALSNQGLRDFEIRTWVRTGDTAPGERERMRRFPPHIVVTTPESLYILLGSDSGRKMLATTRTVIVDEIHAVASNKRGSHLTISLERLEALCRGRLLRIGLSATQKPIETVARFLVGPEAECLIIDTGHRRARDLALEVPSSPLEAVMSGEVWQQVYERLAELIEAHRTTLVFVNTRRLAERVTRQLSERLGVDLVTAHHGSLAKEQRFDAEQRLKGGALKALVATASLELGIDIGEVDLVCQLGSPRSIASFLQRVGRSGHAVVGIPKGRLFPLSRDELVECTALIDCVRRGELDRLMIPERPLDVLAQQIVAEIAAQEWSEDELFALIRHAWPYRALTREDFAAVITMLADGFSTRRGRRGALIHYDAVNRKLRGRRGARLTALTSSGTIPDNADYQVLLEPENQIIGTVNEDFAVESMVGDVFQLGNAAYRVLRVEHGTLRVEDAEGAAPNIPFWLGEAPGRTDELSHSVSRLRMELATRFPADPARESSLRWLVDEIGVAEPAAQQIVDYLLAGHATLGVLPTRDTLVIERFFDEVGGMQLVIHSPYGSRINRAWGLALRKRFCRKFNFELQAAATEDNIVLSLTRAHSFDISDVPRYLHSATIRQLLIEALLDAPMFITRWRWVAGVSLALPRFRGGKKVPPQLARMAAEDLLAAIFPDQVACAENLVGAREIPDHPLIRQTIADCLGEAMDLDGLVRLLSKLEAGEIRVVTRDLTEPSPLALEVLSARPYAYLDDAPLEERRTQAVMSRRWLAPEEASEIGRLDPEAIERVRGEAWPDPANVDELHDALVWLGFLAAEEIQPVWSDAVTQLGREKRVALLRAAPVATPTTSANKPALWVAAERLPQFLALWPNAGLDPTIAAPACYAERAWSREEALTEILRGRLEGLGPVTEASLAAPLAVEPSEISAALAALETEGFAMRGRFAPGAATEEWCERRLLARIHRYTVGRLRAEIQPVAARDFLRFLLSWQRVAPDSRMEGADALEVLVRQLEGFEAAAGAWETEILPARLDGYDPSWLDDQCLSGRIAWARLRPRYSGEGSVTPVRTTPITLLARRHAALWASLSAAENPVNPSPRAQAVAQLIRQRGASFFDELVESIGLLGPQIEEALAELVALGLVTSDSFAGLRALLRKPAAARRRHRTIVFGMESAGRWALARRPEPQARARPEAVE